MSLPESYSKYKFGKAVDAAARMETTEDDEEGVENLLEFKGASRWEVFEAKDDVCITKMFEPKFLQIFVKYCEEAKPPIHSSGHLLVSCLENLVTFCCWARDSTARVAWMKEILDDNPDLRPEVRNGLAMVLVYVFSTAKAVNVGDADMFTVLQNPDSGLGIVNKTSLKIYNDPFMYFSFLKLCISGLIDAGKIPENERQNQVCFCNMSFCWFIVCVAAKEEETKRWQIREQRGDHGLHAAEDRCGRPLGARRARGCAAQGPADCGYLASEEQRK